MICPKCGYDEQEGSEFCSNCGHSFSAPPPYQEQPQAPPVAPSGGEYAAAPPPQGPPAPSSPAGKSKLVPILITVCALLLIGIVVVVLVFTVFKGDGKEGAGDGKQAAGEPADVAEAYLKALQEKDLGGILDLIDPDTLADLEDEYGEEYRDILEGYFFGWLPEELEFSGLEFSQEVKGDRAEVLVQAGKATFVDEYGEKQTADLAVEMSEALELVRKDGTWYISMESFTDWEDYLAGYEEEGDGDREEEEGGDGEEEEALYFESDMLGVGFNYSRGWTPREYSEGLVEVSPDGVSDRAKVSVYTEDLSGVSYGIEDWMQDRADELDAQGWPYESDYVVLLGQQAGRYVFSYLGEASAGYKVMDVFTVVGDTAYIVSYIALEEDFDTYLDGAETIIDSMEMLAGSR